MKTRALAVALGLLLAFPAAAQDPLVEVTFEENSAIPGQPLTLSVTVLVPTWMPTPPLFPSFEAANILVQLPEGASGPTSRTIDGETWSGVSRRYRLTPMVPGSIDISGQTLTITWADPGQTDPLRQTVTLDPITVEGVVPEGAEGLQPFLAAEALTLTREMAEATMPLHAGDSLSLKVTAEIEGTSSMFLPPLLPNVSLEGIAAYPSEPLLEDLENRGKVTGRRQEELTLVAESGGSGAFPEISLDWYNLSSGEVETVTIDGFDVSVDAPRARDVTVSPRLVALYLMFALLSLGLSILLRRVFAPRLQAWRSLRRARYEASEDWAYRAARRAAQARNMGRLFAALDLWAERSAADPRSSARLASALSQLGCVRYGRNGASEQAAWQAVMAALPTARAEAQRATGAKPELPPLNPRAPEARRPV